MMQRSTLLTVLLALFIQGQAFMVSPPAFTRASLKTATASSALFMSQAQPEVETKTKVKQKEKQKQEQKQQQKQKAETGEPVNRKEDDFEDAPMYKLVLLRDDAYDPEHVITRMCSIMEDMDEDAAKTVYSACMSSGKAMVGKYPFEICELFKEQLLRSTPMIFCDMEQE
jgi:ATP-dependent Clp protease adapter protein ClpS